jgi:hypothetical protein
MDHTGAKVNSSLGHISCRTLFQATKYQRMAPSSQLLRQPKQRIQQSRAASVRVNALFVSRSKTAVKEPAAETKAEETKKQ